MQSDKNSIFETYPFLFHKYLLGIRNHNKNYLNYNVNIENTIIKNNIAHLHCYDINLFDDIYGQYIQAIENNFSIIVTYCIDGEIPKYNFTYIQTENYGFDIGPKCIVVEYLRKKNITYNNILFLHSKSDKKQRIRLFTHLINNLDLCTDDIGVLCPPLINCNDVEILSEDTIIPKYEKPTKWEARNYIYMSEIINYFNLEQYDDYYFTWGNCYVLKKSIADIIYGDELMKNILNTKDSFDYGWVKFYYKMNLNMDNKYGDIKYVYYLAKKNDLLMNNIHAMSKNVQNCHPDSMIEHSYERIILAMCRKLNLKIKIAPYKNRRLCTSLSNNLNIVGNALKNMEKIANKTLCLVACHTNSKIKINAVIHNIKYLLEISDDIIIINSNEYHGAIENKIKNIYKNANIKFLYCENSSFLCYTKYIYGIGNCDINSYNNFILTNDSIIITRDLFDFQNIFDDNIQETTLLVSNQNYYHHTDFMRRYNKEGLIKIIIYYKNKIIALRKMKVAYVNIVHEFEMNSTKLFDGNYLYFEKDPVDIHFINPYFKYYLLSQNYPIIKIKRLLFTNYPSDFDINSINFDPTEYKKANTDINYTNDNDTINHFINNGIREGRLYKVGQETQLEDFLIDYLKKISFDYNQ